MIFIYRLIHVQLTVSLLLTVSIWSSKLFYQCNEIPKAWYVIKELSCIYLTILGVEDLNTICRLSVERFFAVYHFGISHHDMSEQEEVNMLWDRKSESVYCLGLLYHSNYCYYWSGIKKKKKKPLSSWGIHLIIHSLFPILKTPSNLHAGMKFPKKNQYSNSNHI